MTELWLFMLIWGVWILIPVIIDGIETLIRIGVVVYHQWRQPEKKLRVHDKNLPNITLVIPAYNEEKIINRCIASIKVQDYPQEKIDIVVIDDGSTDSTVRRIINYAAGRNGNGNGNGKGKHSKLKMNGFANGTVKINGNQYKVPNFYGGLKLLASDYHLGKPEALNTAIESTNGRGDLIITVDSDVVLSPETLKNTAKAFVANPDMGAATGNIEVSWQNMAEIDEEGNPVLDKKGKIVTRKLTFWENVLAKCQFLEYLDSFSLGREFQSRVHSTYILSGAYSVFRKDILKQIFYREATITEDFDLTVDIHRLNSYIGYIPQAKAYLEPVTNWDHLYSQRVRWHRGQLEVSGLHKEMIGNRSFGKMGWMGFPQMLLGDHTLSFPRLIWTPLIFFFGLFGYPMQTVLMALIFMYVFYTGITFLQTASAYFYVDKDTKQHVEDVFFYCFIMPFYRLAIFYFRMSGYLLVLKEPPRWKVSGPMSGIRTGISGFKNGIKNGVNGVKNGNGNGNKNGSEKNGTNGFSNGLNGVSEIKNRLHILKYGLTGFAEGLKHHRQKHHYNNGVDRKDGLRKKDKPDYEAIQSYGNMLPLKKKNGNGNGDHFDLKKAFPRRKPPTEPHKIILSPRCIESYVSEAYYYFNRNLFKDAVIPYNEAIEYVHNGADLALLNLETAKSLFYSGYYDEAWPLLKQAEILTSEPRIKNEIKVIFQRFPEKYQDPDAATLVNMAYSNLEKGLVFKARDCFRGAIEVSNDTADIILLRIEIAKTYYLTGDTANALKDFRAAYLTNKKLGVANNEFESLERLIFSKEAKTTLEECLAKGNKAFDEDNYTGAREYFVEALSKAQNLSQLVSLELAIAKTYFLSKRYEQTREHLDKAKILNPNVVSDPQHLIMDKALPLEYKEPSINYLIDQAYSYLEDGKYTKARSFFRIALEKCKDIESLMLCYLGLGRLFYYGGQMRKARLNLDNALIISRSLGKEAVVLEVETIIKDLPKYYVKDALTSVTKESYDFINKGQFDKARICISKGLALAKDINDLVVLRMELGKVYAYAKQFKKATKEFKEALVLASSSNNEALKREIRAMLAHFPESEHLNHHDFMDKGYSLLASKKLKKAEKAFQESLSLAENKEQLLTSYIELARVKKLQDELDEAEAILNQASNLSSILAFNEASKNELKAALEMIKNEKRTLKFKRAVHRSYEYLEKRNYRKAREAISQGFALADDIESIVLTRVQLGKMYALSGQHKRACKELSAALFIAREIKQEGLQKEIKNLLATLPTKSANFEALMSRGETLFKQGKHILAKRIFDKTLMMVQNPEELLRVYMAQGQLKVGTKEDEVGRRDLKKALILTREFGIIDAKQQVDNLFDNLLIAS